VDQRQSCEDDSSGDTSVMRWLTELAQGDHSAARHLWEFLRQRLLNLAKREVAHSSPRSYDEEDVALSAFDALCRVIQDGHHVFANRHALWRYVAAITVNKARNWRRHENCARRGGGVERVCEDAIFLEAIVSPEPPADVAMLMQEECHRLIARLGRRDVQAVALLKVDGYTNDEVADHLGCTRRSVQRRLAVIREIWGSEKTT
jgi:DNA-directed RNA polymerase specialized sigma24 family protein